MGYWGVVVALKILGQENLLSQQFKGDRNLRERIPFSPFPPRPFPQLLVVERGL